MIFESVNDVYNPKHAVDRRDVEENKHGQETKCSPL